MAEAPEPVTEHENDEVLADEESTLDVFDEEVEEVDQEPTGAEEESPASQQEPDQPEAETDVSGDSSPPDDAESDQERTVPLSALQDERRKRQERDAELEEWRTGKRQPEQQQTQEPPQVPDPVIDPKGYAQHIQNQNQLGNLETKMTLSREIMSGAHEDYSEAETAFLGNVIQKSEDGQVVVTNQPLFNKMMRSQNPAKLMYEEGKKMIEINRRLSPDFENSLREELRKEITQEVVGMLKEKGPNFDFSALPDFTNAAASSTNTRRVNRDDHGIPDDELDVYDD